MPIQVDVDERRRVIADATFAVAAQGGLGAVTIRSVAEELDASTTFITNYLPTRSALLVNAIDALTQVWLGELEHAAATTSGADGLRAVMREAVAPDDDDQVRAQFWVAILASPSRSIEVDTHLAESSSAVLDVIRRVVSASGAPSPETAADMLFLVAQGAFISTVEAPLDWPAGRLERTVDAAVDAVLAASGQVA